MSFWSRLSGLFSAARTAPERPLSGRLMHVGRTVAGLHVDADTALKNATVWACVQYLTRAVAQLPWRVMLETGRGAEVARSHPADWLLHKRPCPDMGSFAWRQTMLGNALLRGNAYAEIQRDNRGVAYALWPIHPERVAVRRAASGLLEYEVWNDGGNVIIPAADMFHIRGFGDGPVGYNVVEYAAQTIGWAQATELFGAGYFANGMNPTGVVEVPGAMSIDAMDALREELERLYNGARGKRTAIFDKGIKFSKVTSSPDESQFVETMQHQVPEICRFFGVPPHKVMHLLNATFSNIEHQSIEVVVDSVTPWCKVFEEEADYKLFGPQNRNAFYTKMNLRGLLRGDQVSRAQYYKTMFEMGMTINQILSLEDMDGIGPDGDTAFVSNNVQTLERAIAAGEAVAPAPPADPEPPVDSADDEIEPAVN